tara:strand:- start:173 stop:637 length:465 start_codon:yes stop_codon:yes gene_type:complete
MARYVPPGLAGEMAIRNEVKRKRKKALDKAMCEKSHGPGWTYNETIGKCMMPVGYMQDGNNVPDLADEIGLPPGSMPSPENDVSISPPEGGSGGGSAEAAIQGEMAKRQAQNILKMQKMQGINAMQMQQAQGAQQLAMIQAQGNANMRAAKARG